MKRTKKNPYATGESKPICSTDYDGTQFTKLFPDGGVTRVSPHVSDSRWQWSITAYGPQAFSHYGRPHRPEATKEQFDQVWQQLRQAALRRDGNPIYVKDAGSFYKVWADGSSIEVVCSSHRYYSRADIRGWGPGPDTCFGNRNCPRITRAEFETELRQALAMAKRPYTSTGVPPPMPSVLTFDDGHSEWRVDGKLVPAPDTLPIRAHPSRRAPREQ